MYPLKPHQHITEHQFDSLLDHGYLILPGYIQGEELATLQAAQRRVLTPWDKIKDNPPADRSQFVAYPYPEVELTGLYRHPELLRIGRRYLKTPDVVYNVGYMLTRYPGFASGDKGHIDNGNNSLLPMSESAREYSQLIFWIHLEEVGPDQAPITLVSHKDKHDNSKAVPLVCPPGTITVFTNYTWHFSTTYRRADGERFAWGFMLGRRDHPFESLLQYTSLGQHPVFNQMVRSLTAEERCLFRFPPPNHPYYTKQTLAALEKQYPGWNARGEYNSMD